MITKKTTGGTNWKKRFKRWRRENKVCCSHLECVKGLCWEVACSDAIDRKEKREEVGNREVQGEQLKKRASREGRRDLGLRNECGVKGGGLGVWVRGGQSERRAAWRGEKTGEQETQKEELYRAFDGESRDKKMYFSCFLCCPPSPLGNFPLLSPSLLPSSSVWYSGKIGRKPNRARHTGCSLLTLTGGGRALQNLLTSPAETPLTYRPERPSIRHNSLEEAGGDGMRGKMWSCDAQWVTQATNTVKN